MRWSRRGKNPATQLLEGLLSPKPGDVLARWLFLRGLGLVYLVAFRSLRRQLLGLYGERGITPVAPLLEAARREGGPAAYRLVPSLLWLDPSDAGLLRACRAGELLATSLMLGVAPRASAAGCWALYLSFVSAGREFLSFQWDSLLLEAGVGGVLVAPKGMRPRWSEPAPPAPAVWLSRWLLFRLYFESGLAKLQSRDVTWRDLSASAYHHETQPLPAALAWHARELPPAVHRASTALVLAGECALPLLVLAPRRVRKLAFPAVTALQAAIALSGNYGFFNLLSGVLGLWLLDDVTLGRAGGRVARVAAAAAPRPRWWQTAATAAIAAPLALISAARLSARLGRPLRWRWLDRSSRAITPLSIVNSYGLFTVMTTTRPEVILEGTRDGSSWHEYRFAYKASDVRSPPRRSAPHMPRLDWMMWFLPYGPPPLWFKSFVARLLQGAPEVRSLLAHDPFGDEPPLAVRASLYDYKMTSRSERAELGAWWKRRRLGTYLPPTALQLQR